MSEKEVIDRSKRPFTRILLADQFRQLGIKPGHCLLLHSSLSQIGYVPGGAVAVIQALMDVLTPEGTLIMPTHTSDNSDPSGWQNPPIPEAWHQIVRDNTPAYDPLRTPTRGMGAIPELFRTWPNVFRSSHPQVSFAAWGKEAQMITAVHALNAGLGEASPLARIYELDGQVLLLGVGYDRNTSFHLAEHRAECRPKAAYSTAVLHDGRRVWKTYQDIDIDDEDFSEIGAEMEKQLPITIGMVGHATCRLFSQVTAVDFAVNRLRESNSK